MILIMWKGQYIHYKIHQMTGICVFYLLLRVIKLFDNNPNVTEVDKQITSKQFPRFT